MEDLQKIIDHISNGHFFIAEKLLRMLLKKVTKLTVNNEYKYTLLFNIAGQFTDLGHMNKKKDLGNIGCKLMEEYQKYFLKIIPISDFYYNFANAKSNLISIEDPFELTFKNIEELVEVKNYYWKALKAKLEEGDESLELYVNLANILKRQFRLSEALRYYDIVNSHDLDIPQAKVNRSDTLEMLNVVSQSYSIKMIQEIINGYQFASESNEMPVMWIDYYKSMVVAYQAQLSEMRLSTEDISEKESTNQEYENLSIYRKFCLNQHLTLSEHGLYCACAGSARDNLTIPLVSKSVSGKFVPQMEMVLNRIKSEFSLARRNYYEYLNPTNQEIELLHEDCFTELLNNEMLGISVEKLRTSFRLCFGILDKIAMAICELYDVPPPNGEIYFQNFWRLNEKGRREKFESIKNPGLLALYSIATDLNMHKNGEWAYFKEWRNSLEHGLFIILENESNLDAYSTFERKNIQKVTIDEFESYVKQLLQLTRSAIFSFVFSVRDSALKTNIENGFICALDRKNFKV